MAFIGTTKGCEFAVEFNDGKLTIQHDTKEDGEGLALLYKDNSGRCYTDAVFHEMTFDTSTWECALVGHGETTDTVMSWCDDSKKYSLLEIGHRAILIFEAFGTHCAYFKFTAAIQQVQQITEPLTLDGFGSKPDRAGTFIVEYHTIHLSCPDHFISRYSCVHKSLKKALAHSLRLVYERLMPYIETVYDFAGKAEEGLTTQNMAQLLLLCTDAFEMAQEQEHKFCDKKCPNMHLALSEVFKSHTEVLEVTFDAIPLVQAAIAYGADVQDCDPIEQVPIKTIQ